MTELKSSLFSGPSDDRLPKKNRETPPDDGPDPPAPLALGPNPNSTIRTSFLAGERLFWPPFFLLLCVACRDGLN